MNSFNYVRQLAQVNNRLCFSHDVNIKNPTITREGMTQDEARDYLNHEYDFPYGELRKWLRGVENYANNNGWNQNLLNEANELRAQIGLLAFVENDAPSNGLLQWVTELCEKAQLCLSETDPLNNNNNNMSKITELTRQVDRLTKNLQNHIERSSHNSFQTCNTQSAIVQELASAIKRSETAETDIRTALVDLFKSGMSPNEATRILLTQGMSPDKADGYIESAQYRYSLSKYVS